MEVVNIQQTSDGEITYVVKKGTTKKFAWKIKMTDVLSKIVKDNKSNRLCIHVDLGNKHHEEIRKTIEQFKNSLINIKIETRSDKQTKDYIKDKYVENNNLENDCYKFEIALECQFIKCHNKEKKCYKDDYNKIKPHDKVELIIEYIGFKTTKKGYSNIYLIKQIKRFLNCEITENNIHYNKNEPKYGDENYNNLYKTIYASSFCQDSCYKTESSDDDYDDYYNSKNI